MLNDVVNKIVFELTCETEIAAKRMRNEILNYKASQISSILSEVLAEKGDKQFLWKINKIEIDLGNIHLEEIGTDLILSKFKDLLSRTIDETAHDLRKNVYPRGLLAESPDKSSHSNALSLSIREGQLDIIKHLLLHGDLPWWLDKGTFSGVAKTVESVIEQNYEGLVSFLNTQKSNRDVNRRMRLFFSPVSISLLNRISPGIISKVSGLEKETVHIERLSNLHLKKISDSFYERISAVNKNLKSLMISKLLRDAREDLLPKIKMLAVLGSDEIVALELLLSSNRPASAEQANAMQILQKLNIFQLEFLSYPGLIKTTAGKAKTPPADVRKQKSRNPALERMLPTASAKVLSDLKKVFSQYQKKGFTRGKMISLIIEHPYFFKYKLLALFANLSFEFAGDSGQIARLLDPENLLTSPVFRQKVRQSQSALQRVMKSLTKKQSLIVNEIFSGRATPTISAKKNIEKILNRLPDTSLLMISVLAQLNKKEIESLAPVHFTTALKEPRKAIIENAGLCLLAPYLPTFFNHLGLIKNGNFKNKGSAHRALYLLEYVVSGRQRNYEYVMQLNKLLCGLNIDESITGYKRLTALERSESEDLIISVITHWKALKSTSQKGFRSSFLQRKGILTEDENVWILQVERKGYDLLLDSIPWSFNLIKFPWMEKMIQVEW